MTMYLALADTVKVTLFDTVNGPTVRPPTPDGTVVFDDNTVFVLRITEFASTKIPVERPAIRPSVPTVIVGATYVPAVIGSLVKPFEVTLDNAIVVLCYSFGYLLVAKDCYVNPSAIRS
jgi:hypothetical protein